MTGDQETPEQTLYRILYVGTYTSGGAEGIYTYRMDCRTAELTHLQTSAGIDEPSYLTFDQQGRYLYAVNELSEYQGQPSGAVSAFRIDPKTHKLKLLSQQPSRGGAPCYISLDPAGKHALVANYEGGNVTVLPVQPDGSLGEPSHTVEHGTQDEEAHAHSILPDLNGTHILAADLGMDQLRIYTLDEATGTLLPHTPTFVTLEPGAGPRHIAFHPNGRFVYVINELNSTITAFTYDAQAGRLSVLQTVPALPDGFSGENACADLHLSPSGRYLYGSNRGHDSIVMYEIDAETGRLTYGFHEPTQGKAPRNFVIDPTGIFLLVANMDSDNLVTFRLEPETGRLVPTGQVLEVPSPVCLKFLPT